MSSSPHLRTSPKPEGESLTTRGAAGGFLVGRRPSAEIPLLAGSAVAALCLAPKPSSSDVRREFAFIVSLEINIYDSNLCVHDLKICVFVIVLILRAVGLLLLCFWDESDYSHASAYFLNVRLIF